MTPLAFLDGGGRVGALMRAHDWSRSPLGAPAAWPQALRTVVGLLLDSQFPMFVAWGDELGFLYNDAYAEILGAKHPQALGARFADIWAEIWTDISPLIDAAMAGQSSYREDLPLVMNRKGFDEQTWFTFSYSPVHGDDGRVAGMFCAVSETTPKILAERALRASETRLRLALEAGHMGEWELDVASDRAERALRHDQIFGYDRLIDHWGYRTFLEHVVPEDRERVDAAFASAIDSGSGCHFECRIRRAGDGAVRWIAMHSEPRLGPDGRTERMFGLVQDITGQRQVQEDLNRLNATLEQRVADALAERRILADIVEGTDAFVQVVGLDYRWLAINRAASDEFERIYGVRPGIGVSMLELLAAQPRHRDAVHAVWRRALAGEQFTQIAEFGDTARDRRWYEMKFNVLRGRDGRQIGAYQFVYDVTQRLKDQARLAEAEDQLHQSQKVEAIGQLTGGVAHDFNNLLTPIVGALDMLRVRFDGDERARRVTTAALQAAERARVLVQRMLAFSRRQHLEPRAVDIGRLVDSMKDLIGRSLGPRVEVLIRLQDSLPPARVDPNQLELALLNLAVNARDAMRGHGRLTISAELQAIAGHVKLAPGRYICLAVADDGVGMDDETLRRATEPFFTTKDVGQGTGLGLSSVLGLAEQSGGEFRLESRRGLGTTATLWLPVADAAADDAAALRDVAGPQRNRDATPILLVDDDELVRIGTADMLSESGFSVITATSAAEALQLLREGIPAEVLVTDYAMPGMTGVDLAHAARALRPNLPVLMVTGFASVGEAEAGELARLAKPFRRDELAAALERLLHGARVERDRAEESLPAP